MSRNVESILLAIAGPIGYIVFVLHIKIHFERERIGRTTCCHVKEDGIFYVVTYDKEEI